jgi:hypothetical protein
MKLQRLTWVLMVMNLVLLLIVLGQGWPVTAQIDAPILRGRALELVDDGGRVRSRLNVESDGAVVFRLIDRNGTIRVKLAADEDGSGLLLLDEATEPGIQMIARRKSTTAKPATTGVVLTGADGKSRVIRP